MGFFAKQQPPASLSRTVGHGTSGENSSSAWAVQAFIAVVAILTILVFYLSPRENNSLHLSRNASLSIPGYSWNQAPKTIVIAVRYGCKYCQASLPFYERLLTARTGKSGTHTNLIFISQDNYVLSRRSVAATTPSNELFSDLKFPPWITGTPTLVIVNSTGKIEGGWSGILTVHEENEVLSTAMK